MATRALIGYLNPSNSITTTYNHYDGYPENLGVALQKHYSTDEKANEIANMGYVSYVNPETGDIEANNTDKPVTVGGGDDLVSTLQYFKEEADGTDYAYLFAPSTGDWMYAPTAMKMEDFVDVFALGIDFQDEDDMADYDSIDSMEESYVDRWKSFISENDDAKVRFEKIRDNAYRMLKHEDGKQVNAYVDALERQIKFKPSDADEIINYDKSDFQADFDDYVSDKMDS
ncbi:hypothetical protein OAU24_00575 [bacterium]|jgi:hypothetical protein|nr:hypothetical protein [bacterium]